MVEPGNLILQYLFNAVYTAMWFAVLDLTLAKRYSRTATFLLQALWFVLYRLITLVLPFMSEFRIIFFVVAITAISLLCYKDPWTKIIFSTAAVYMVVETNELVGAGLYFPDCVLQGNVEALNAAELVELWGIYLSTGSLMFFLLYLFLNRHKFSLSAEDWSMFAIFPISQYVLMYGWLDSIRLSGGGRSFFFLLVMFACIFADVSLFSAMVRLSQRAQLAAENNILAAQIDAQEKHYQALAAQYESIRRMRHDIANHVSAMQSLLASGRSSDAQEYLEELVTIPFDTNLGLCKNPVVDAFLHNKLEEARSAGIDVTVRIDLDADIPVSNVDLIRIFGNLIDNALEACEGTETPSVSIACSKAYGCLVITTQNPIRQEKPDKGRRIPGLDRGIGMHVLADVAKKYNGSISFNENKRIFTTELIIGIGV